MDEQESRDYREAKLNDRYGDPSGGALRPIADPIELFGGSLDPEEDGYVSPFSDPSPSSKGGDPEEG